MDFGTVAMAALALSVAACDGRRRDRPADMSLPPVVLPTTPVPQPSPSPMPAPTPTAPSTGIPECDALLGAMERCEAIRGNTNIGQLRDAYRQAAGLDASMRATVAGACKQALESIGSVCGSAPSPLPRPSPSPLPPPPTSGLSASERQPPSAVEWQGAGVPATVAGAGLHGCVARRLGAWLKVTCEGPDAMGGWPVSARVARADDTTPAFVYFGAGQVVVVARFEPGTHLVAELSWTHARRVLRLRWPSDGGEAEAALVADEAADEADDTDRRSRGERGVAW